MADVLGLAFALARVELIAEVTFEWFRRRNCEGIAVFTVFAVGPSESVAMTRFRPPVLIFLGAVGAATRILTSKRVKDVESALVEIELTRALVKTMLALDVRAGPNLYLGVAALGLSYLNVQARIRARTIARFALFCGLVALDPHFSGARVLLFDDRTNFTKTTARFSRTIVGFALAPLTVGDFRF